MSCYFDRDTVSLPGFAEYFRDNSLEERGHAQVGVVGVCGWVVVGVAVAGVDELWSFKGCVSGVVRGAVCEGLQC